VLSVALTPHGDWVLSGSKDRGVQFWDPHTGVAQLMLQGHKNSGMLNRSSSSDMELILRSHFSGSQPNRRCLRDGQRRHARSYLEVCHSSPHLFPPRPCTCLISPATPHRRFSNLIAIRDMFTSPASFSVATSSRLLRCAAWDLAQRIPRFGAPTRDYRLAE
jgi:WD40 repeat protein